MSELVEEKIQIIAKEIIEAGASEWTITKIIKALGELNTTSEKKLREKALELLKEIDTNAAIVYERFSKMKVYTTQEAIKGFNRGNIITSLLKETSLSRSVAEKITLEVENQIKDSKISFLTPALIRELVNAKLLTYGFESVREQYTRVGEPVYEVGKKLLVEPYSGETVREYNILLTLPATAREMHFEGTIHIEDIEGFSHRPYAYSFIAEKKETLTKTICSNLKFLSQNRKYFCLTPSIYGFTFACAPFTKSDRTTKECAELIESALSILPDSTTISLELFTPKVLESMGAHKINAAKIANHIFYKNSVVGVDSQYSLKLIDAEGKQFMILNNSNEEYFPLSKTLFSPTRGIELFVNVNLEKLSESGDEKQFFEKLTEISEEIKKLTAKKRELLSQKPYLKQFNLEELKTAVGFTNIYKASENFPGVKPTEFSTRMAKELTKLFEENLLFGLASAKAKNHFIQTSGKEILSQETMELEECLSSKKCCFTGKAASIKEVNELIEKKVKQIEYVGL